MGTSILTAGALAAAAALAVGLAAVGGAGVQSQRAAGIADAAALAAADALAGFAVGEPCALAGRVASVQGAHVSACDVDGLVATVEVTLSSRWPVVAIARAGPPS